MRLASSTLAPNVGRWRQFSGRNPVADRPSARERTRRTPPGGDRRAPRPCPRDIISHSQTLAPPGADATEDLTEIINRTTQVREVSVQRVMTGPRALSFRELVREVPIAAHVCDLAAHIVLATHPQWERSPEQTRRFVRYGASPRGAQALVLGAKVRALSEGRYTVSVEDLRAMALPSLRHRIILNFEGEAEAVDVDRLITQIIEAAENMSATEKEVFLRWRIEEGRQHERPPAAVAPSMGPIPVT
jgi:hypothetical protein